MTLGMFLLGAAALGRMKEIPGIKTGITFLTLWVKSIPKRSFEGAAQSRGLRLWSAAWGGA
ncbi:MAG: hypothetical protein AMJ79_04760 [Phycisphaerae bacterium SM23_30]|nr:MAG: hypothetical protein AMJ79_04760 [Phycisphaerae bacterium SM23_30]